MATEMVQTTQTKQPGKQELKEEVKTETPDGTYVVTKHEYRVDSKPESVLADPYLRAAQAELIIHRNVLWSLGAGVLPIPIVDFLAVMAVQIKMLTELSDFYGVGFQADVAKKIIYSLLSSLGSVALGSAVSFSLSKLIPGIGTTVGAVSVPLFAGAFTNALGRMFLMHFESGGTLFDFDPHAMRAHFGHEYERSRERVARMRREEVIVSRAGGT